jgi:hypothetical protein
MEHYLNIDGDSGVSGYEIGVDFIRVQFSTGSIYLYTYSPHSAGKSGKEIIFAARSTKELENP